MGRFLTMLTEEEIKQKRELVKECRQLVCAFAVGTGLPPSKLPEVYGADSVLHACVLRLKQLDGDLGIHRTIRRDLEGAEELLFRFIRLDIKGLPGCLISDGASLKEDKAIAILFFSHQSMSGRPTLLCVIFPDAVTVEGAPLVYNFEKAAEDIRAACERFGIDIATQVTCFMGDNVSFNDRVAAALGVPRGKCLPHGFSLVVKKGVFRFPLMKDLIQTASAVIFAGGTHRRAAELKSDAYNLEPSKLLFYPNRFGSAIQATQYRIANFAAVERWHCDSALRPEPDSECDSDDDSEDDGDTPLGKWARAEEAYRDKRAELILRVVDRLYGTLPALVKETSADDVDRVDSTLLDKLGVLRDTLEHAKRNTAFAKEIVESLKGKLSAPVMSADFNDWKEALKHEVSLAAGKSLKAFDKHIQPMMETLRKRFMFDPRNEPPTVTDAERLNYKFFGIKREDWTPALSMQYLAYKAAWYAMPDDAKEEAIVAFWKGKAGAWPELAKVALWWLETPTSSIAAERVFAVMRNVYVPIRQSMHNETLARELMFRVNKTLLEAKTIEKLDELEALVKGGRPSRK